MNERQTRGRSTDSRMKPFKSKIRISECPKQSPFIYDAAQLLSTGPFQKGEISRSPSMIGGMTSRI